jgi:Gram positive anchor.
MKFIFLIVVNLLTISLTQSVKADENHSVLSIVPVSQVIDNDKDLSLDYELKADDINSPMPNGSSNGIYRFNLRGNSKKNITIDFSEAAAGKYVYTLKVISPEKSTYKLDKQVYKVIVDTVWTREGFLAMTTLTGPGNSKPAEILFNHKYIKKSLPPIKTNPAKPSLETIMKGMLPNTGEKTSIYLSLVGLFILIFFGRRYKQNEDVK